MDQNDPKIVAPLSIITDEENIFIEDDILNTNQSKQLDVQIISVPHSASTYRNCQKTWDILSNNTNANKHSFVLRQQIIALAQSKTQADHTLTADPCSSYLARKIHTVSPILETVKTLAFHMNYNVHLTTHTGQNLNLDLQSPYSIISKPLPNYYLISWSSG